MSPKINKTNRPPATKPLASMMALASVLGMPFEITEFWRVDLVNKDGARAAVGEYDDREVAIDAAWMLNGGDGDCEQETLSKAPTVRAEVVGPFQVLAVQLGKAEATGGEA